MLTTDSTPPKSQRSSFSAQQQCFVLVTPWYQGKQKGNSLWVQDRFLRYTLPQTEQLLFPSCKIQVYCDLSDKYNSNKFRIFPQIPIIFLSLPINSLGSTNKSIGKVLVLHQTGKLMVHGSMPGRVCDLCQLTKLVQLYVVYAPVRTKVSFFPEYGVPGCMKVLGNYVVARQELCVFVFVVNFQIYIKSGFGRD